MQSPLLSVLRPGPVRTFVDAAAWWADHVERTRGIDRPVDRAIVSASAVDRLGFAFAGGYASALSALVPSLPTDRPSSLAATEEAGAHPRAILTMLTRDGGGFVLSGKKQWITLARAGGVVLVVARTADSALSERPELVVVRVASDAPGVTLRTLAPLPFVPEIPHAELSLDRVQVSPGDVLPGDGYADYLKPFRTIEDLHVHAALLAWLSATGARAAWPTPVRERLLSLLVTVRALASEDPKNAIHHVALGGVLGTTHALVQEIEPLWASAPEETGRLFARDRALLSVAGKARAARLTRAWSLLST